MTTATRSMAPNRVQCPVEGCTYKAENQGSIPAHIAMAHPPAVAEGQIPMDPGLADLSAQFEASAAKAKGAGAELDRAVAEGRWNPDELTCRGSVHVPGCEHLRPQAPVGSPSPAGAALLEIPLDLVDVGVNVRVTVEAIDELAASIAEHGVLQPVKVTRLPDDRYRLLWGQRRVLAARKAGLTTIPAIIEQRTATWLPGSDRAIEQLVENLHRADLNPIDRAQAMRAVVDAGISQADLARKLGIAPSTVANDLRLLEAAPAVVTAVAEGSISPAHAKAVLGLPAEDQVDLVNRAVAGRLSAHDLEAHAKWQRDRVAEQTKADGRSAKITAHVIKALERAEVPKAAEVRLSLPYNLGLAVVLEAVVAAGWTAARSGWGRKVKDCGCSAFVVEVSDYKGEPDVRPTCIDVEHQRAAQAAKDDERDAKVRRDAAEAGQLREALEVALADLPPTLGRLLMRWTDNYTGKTWTEYSELDGAAIARALALRISNGNGAKPIPVAKVVAALAEEATS